MGPILSNKACRNVPHCYLRKTVGKFVNRKYYVNVDLTLIGVRLQVEIRLLSQHSRA